MNLNRMFIVVVFMVAVTIFPKVGFAAHPQKVKDLVKPYVEAFKVYNRVEIKKAFDKISADTKSLTYISENMPNEFKLYNAWSLVERMEALNERYGNRNIADDYVPVEATLSDSTTGSANSSNGSISHDRRNQNAPSNQSRITNASINNNRISNGQISRSFSNNRQTSNRDRIRASKRRR